MMEELGIKIIKVTKEILIVTWKAALFVFRNLKH